MRLALLMTFTTAAGLAACAPIPGQPYGYAPGPSYGYTPSPYYPEPAYPYAEPGYARPY